MAIEQGDIAAISVAARFGFGLEAANLQVSQRHGMVRAGLDTPSLYHTTSDRTMFSSGRRRTREDTYGPSGHVIY